MRALCMWTAFFALTSGCNSGTADVHDMAIPDLRSGDMSAAPPIDMTAADMELIDGGCALHPCPNPDDYINTTTCMCYTPDLAAGGI